jgi:tetratricopeptide (TPR) repeat protein
MDSGRWQQAEAALQEARRVQADFGQRFTTLAADRTFLQESALTYFNLGLLYHRVSTAPWAADRARKYYETAAVLLRDLTEKYPDAQDVCREATNCDRHLALFLAEHGQTQAALDKFIQADLNLTKLTSRYPKVPAYAAEKGRNKLSWADFTAATRNLRGAVQHYIDAVEALEKAKDLERRTDRQRVIGTWLREARPKLARGYMELSQFEQAARQWGRASEEAEGPQRDGCRAWEAEAWARAGDPLRAAAAVDQLTDGAEGHVYWIAARSCALASAAAPAERVIAATAAVADPATTAVVSAATAVVGTDACAARAVGRLRQAFAKGFTDVAPMLLDPDLGPLRRRPDFAALLWDLADLPAARPAPAAAP